MTLRSGAAEQNSTPGLLQQAHDLWTTCLVLFSIYACSDMYKQYVYLYMIYMYIKKYNYLYKYIYDPYIL